MTSARNAPASSPRRHAAPQAILSAWLAGVMVFIAGCGSSIAGAAAVLDLVAQT